MPMDVGPDLLFLLRVRRDATCGGERDWPNRVFLLPVKRFFERLTERRAALRRHVCASRTPRCAHRWTTDSIVRATISATYGSSGVAVTRLHGMALVHALY
jgi:hypothetical protein